MQWWNDFVTWLTSAGARPALFSAAVLAVAVIVSGLLSAWIARGTVKGILSRSERDQKASAVSALLDAATEASVWNSLTPQEQVLSDRAVGQADILVRLLPIKNSGIAANWSNHQLAEMKRNSATFGYQLDPAIAEFRDRLIEWQNKPRRAKKIFQNDLERWNFENTGPEKALIAEQDAWVAKQHHEQHTTPAEAAKPASELGADTQTQQLIDDVGALDVHRADGDDVHEVESGETQPVESYREEYADETHTDEEQKHPVS